MPKRYILLIKNEIYHIYNRGVAKQPIFLDKRDYEKFILTITYYRYAKLPLKLSRFLQLAHKERDIIMAKLNNDNKKLVEVLCYTLMPNHFHLIVKQLEDDGISKYMRLILNSWTHHFNKRHVRVGSLFQGVFKAVRIEDDEQLIHLSRYIHINPVVSYLVKENDLLFYPWSSINDYQKGNSVLVEISTILGHFSSFEKYKKFLFDQIDYAKEINRIKHLRLET